MRRLRRRCTRENDVPHRRRTLYGDEGRGAYPVDAAALRHDAGVEQETSDKRAANDRFGERVSTRYREGWLPG